MRDNVERHGEAHRRVEGLHRLGRRPVHDGMVPRRPDRRRSSATRFARSATSSGSRRSSRCTRVSPCRVSTSERLRRVTSGRRRASTPRSSSSSITRVTTAKIRHAYAGDDKVNSADRGVDTLIKSLRENGLDAEQYIPRGLAHGNSPERLRRDGIGVAQRHGQHPRRVALPRQDDQVRRSAADVLGDRQPLVRLAAVRDRGAPRVRVLATRRRSSTTCRTGSRAIAWDPRINARAARATRRPHPHVKNWPTDGKPHPERTIRNRIFGRNAAEAYNIDADAQARTRSSATRCRSSGTRATSKATAPCSGLRWRRTRSMESGRRNDVMHELWSNPWSP